MRCFFILIFVFISFGIDANPSNPYRLAGLMCHSEASAARCILTSPVNLRIQHFFLHSPERLVVDIQKGDFLNRSNIRISNNAILKNYRFAHQKKNRNMRIVLDLKQLVSLKILQNKAGGLYQWQFILSPRGMLPHQAEKFSRKNFSSRLPSPQITRRKIMVVIDPGHGGKDPGATGPRGTREKNIVLEISRQIQRQINQQPGFMAVLTRNGDYYLPLRERLAVARKYRPDLFIAIHADAYPQRDAVGASVYALSLRGATSEAARWLATKENESELMGGVDLGDKSHLLKSVLLDLSQSATIRASLQLGGGIIHSLQQIGPLHHERVEQAAFVVLKSPDIPSLLVETGFITNPFEERKLSSSAYQRQLASSITRGIYHYFLSHPPRDALFAAGDSFQDSV